MHYLDAMTMLKIVSTDGTTSTVFIRDRLLARGGASFSNCSSFEALEGAPDPSRLGKGCWPGAEVLSVVANLEGVGERLCLESRISDVTKWTRAKAG